MKKSKKKILLNLIKPVKFQILLAMIISGISALSLIISLLLISLTLTSLFENTKVAILGIHFSLYNTILLLAIFTVSSFLLRLFSFIVSHLAAFKLEQILRTEISLHLSKLPLGFIISNGSGRLKKIIQTDVRALHTLVADSTPMIAKSIVAPLSTFIILIIIDYRFALVSLGVLIVGWLAMAFAMKDSEELRKKYESSQANINKVVVEFAQAMPVVRTFDDGSNSFNKYQGALDIYKKNLNNWMKTSSFPAKLGILILSPLPTIIAVLTLGFILQINNNLELFSFVSALFLSTGMADSMMPIMWINNHIKKSNASAIKIQELLDVEPLAESKIPRTPRAYNIDFENVYFKYENTKNFALADINFSIKENTTIALIGASGAGKSTIAKLIPRFWDITQGKICIGGINIKDINTQKLMEIVSFVFQDTFLFHDTIYNNIKISKPNATKEEIIDAAKAAQIDEFINSLPNKYETIVKERGHNLSGGQKQRITIARAILKDSPIIVLDEATAFSDSENEEKIIKALSNLTKNKTVIMIAHRLSTIINSDQILVFDKGQVVEKGKHEELIKNKHLYLKHWQKYKEASNWNLEKGIENEK